MDESAKNHDLPEELVQEILFRVPAKYLSDLKFVCKSWRSLISNPGFIRAHLACSTPEILVSVNDWDSHIYHDYSVNLEDNGEPYRLPLPRAKGERDLLYQNWACDGMFLLESEKNSGCLSICNPVTGSLTHLPPTQYIFQHRGLVHDTSTGKYKVFGISYRELFDNLYTVWTERRIMVFEQGGLNSSDWKLISAEQPCKRRAPFSSHILSAKGRLYWIEIFRMEHKLYSAHLCSADARKEEHRDVQLTFELGWNHFYSLSESEGTLYITIFNPDCFETWVWKDEKKNLWEKWCYSSSLYSDIKKQVNSPDFSLARYGGFIFVVSSDDEGNRERYIYDQKKKKMNKLLSHATLSGIYVTSLVNWE